MGGGEGRLVTTAQQHMAASRAQMYFEPIRRCAHPIPHAPFCSNQLMAATKGMSFSPTL